METNKRVFLNRFFLFLIVLGGGMLAVSFLAAPLLGIQPCLMCKMQRIPFFLLIVNSYLGMATSCKGGFFRVAQISLLLGGILGIGHFLMQIRMIPDPCATPKGLSSMQEFSQLLTSSKCSDLTWKILGVPVSLINAGFCFGVLGISIRGNRKKSRRELSGWR